MPDQYDLQQSQVNVWHRVAGDALMYLNKCMYVGAQREYEVVGLNIKVTKDEPPEVLVVVKAIGNDGTPLVAFHSDVTLIGALSGVSSRLKNGHFKWKVDQYANGYNGKQG